MSVSDEEYEEEEVLVLIEMAGIMDNQLLQKPDSKCKILGVDTAEPILQIGNYILTGEYEDMVGTAVLFEEVEDSESSQDSEKISKKLKYLCKTGKKLVTKRAFVHDRKSAEDVVIESVSKEADTSNAKPS